MTGGEQMTLAKVFSGLMLLVTLTNCTGCRSPKEVDLALRQKYIVRKNFCSGIATEGREFRSICGMKMAWIPPGKHTIIHKDLSSYEIRNKRGFWIGIHEVTQRQLKTMQRWNPSNFKGLDLPVDSIKFNEAREFARILTRHEEAAARIPGYRFDLPTKTQWEYAARAGMGEPFQFGDEITAVQANIDCRKAKKGESKKEEPKKDVFLDRTVKVGSYRANGFGLYDIHGNVREWVLNDKKRGDSGELQATRGGSWWDKPDDCQIHRTTLSNMHKRSPENGFRLVLVPTFRQELLIGPMANVGLGVWGLLIFIPGSLTLYWLMTQRARSLNRVFSRFAHLYKGKVTTPASMSTYPCVVFPYRGIDVQLDFFPSGPPQDEMFTCLTFHMDGTLKNQPLRLEVSPLMLRTFRQVKMRGMEELPHQSQDSPLSSVEVRASDMDLLQKLLAKGLDEKIRDLDLCGGRAPAYLSMNSQRLVVKKMKFIYSLNELRDYALKAFEFIDILIEYYEMAIKPDEFVLIEDGGPSSAELPICVICGTAIEEKAVSCNNCDTLHHADCWEYNGACATFACGSTECSPA